MGAKGTLIENTGNKVSPANAEASEFKSPGGPARGFEGGKGELVKQSTTQEGPRHLADDGSLTPSVDGKAGKAFTVGQSTAGAGTAIKHNCSVNFNSGARTDSESPKEL